MVKKAIIKVENCLDCPYCSESDPEQGDLCFHDNSPNGEDCTKIPNVYSLPDWCPLEDI